ncbi:MAG: bifunctional phosphopantothenoylcysteine decarboxylase/phosphopantothenate--cysteine ligase CoaBC [Candidatus Planktophila sp.]|jgi:phosphopantothenoylcysteine decarboxylase/phosphopantothenate--cysteine ligase|nr:bifunctional phosphopantothenoylcysteine decarboxylase/phosphopantothenate--cysteine ligase CoaBC [Candidatus Planktophila sp.]
MSAPAREIILGVGGGIAAYKACDLLRRLQDRGFAVTVVPTPSSLNFVGSATWEALSGRQVTTQVFESVDQVRHVSLARIAEAIVIAPATADLIARIAAGRADDLLTNCVLASDAPILIVPAMHPNMWFNAATQANVATLRSRGIDVMEPSEGSLTSGDVGKGRFPDTAEIIDRFTGSTLRDRDLTGVRVLVTAGGTREAIDPVRFIGNKSTGKQGVAIAEAAQSRGAQVTLLIANSEITSHPLINRIDLQSVGEMKVALEANFPECDALFMAAAISDVRPDVISGEKIKKGQLNSISLVENPDLLASLPADGSQIVVAFAAETDKDSIAEAQSKMARKNADLIYLNNVSNGAIFGSEMTSGSIIDATGLLESLSDISKENLAHALINHAISKSNKLG